MIMIANFVDLVRIEVYLADYAKPQDVVCLLRTISRLRYHDADQGKKTPP